ncbi:SMI1/KNR4 family protein [Streptomyces sp. NPDC006339]|uniref:SMI1/KNR4 family protein n=1 Tax=Streptomyces sp. NPDC006339 TaxID=3156755 RepID=UPI0033B3C80A
MARFDDICATFWDEDPHGSLAPLTDPVVREAERRLGVRLPQALLEILRIRNGGLVADAWNAFPTDVATSWSETHVPFDELLGVGRPGDEWSLLESPSLVEEWGLPSPLVLLSGDGHCWIALDYRACGPHGEPSVTWFDTESGTDSVTELPLARDFRSFVERLTSADSLDPEPAGDGGR